MRKVFKLNWFVAASVAGALVLGTPHAQARDFISSFFDVLSGRPPPPSQRALGYGAPDNSFFPPEQATPAPAPAAPVSTGRGTAYCVRTCDGRHFPIAATSDQARTATCNSMCPASETTVFYGSSIDRATTKGGKPYSSLPNAFKYRDELVAACTCNGKDPVGLAKISIEDDTTIRKGDIVAGENGLIVATTAARKNGATANFSPAPERIRAQFERAASLTSR